MEEEKKTIKKAVTTTKQAVKTESKSSEVGFAEWLKATKKVNSFPARDSSVREAREKAQKELEKIEDQILKQL